MSSIHATRGKIRYKHGPESIRHGKNEDPHSPLLARMKQSNRAPHNRIDAHGVSVSISTIQRNFPCLDRSRFS
jgi:hypothetical protein